MFFNLMLWLMAKRLSTLANSDDAFKQQIKGCVCVIQFRTADRRVARYFSFTAGSVKTRKIVHDNPSISFTFQSTAIARNLILSMARNPKDKAVMIEAINQGKLRLQGDISLLAWFMAVSEHLPPDRIDFSKVTNLLKPMSKKSDFRSP